MLNITVKSSQSQKSLCYQICTLSLPAFCNDFSSFLLQSGATPLCLAAEHSDVSAIKLLLQNRADVNASWVVPRVGVVLTPLSLAAFLGREDVVAVLVEAGARINAPSKVGGGALKWVWSLTS